MHIAKEKRGILLIIILFFFYIYNINAILPDITNFNAQAYGAYGNNVKLEWSYAAYGASCTQNWDCSDWSSCTNDQQTRNCNDLNNCNTDLNKPDESQSCISSFKLIPDKTEGKAPLTVNFNAQNNFDFAACQIEFGDGNSDLLQSVQDVLECKFQHTYENPGSYGVKLTIQSLDGTFEGDDFVTIDVTSTNLGGSAVRDTLNKITGKSIFDVFKDTFNNIINAFKGLLGLKKIGSPLSSYNFEIYRNNDLIDSGTSEKYCTRSSAQSKDYVCSYSDRELQPGNYLYGITINKAGESTKYSSSLVEIKARGGVCTPNAQISGTCFVCNNDGTAYGTDNSKCLDGSICSAQGQCVAQQTCTPGALKSGTICLVCNSQGTAYGTDNSECNTGQTCNSQGQCVLTTTVSAYGLTVTKERDGKGTVQSGESPRKIDCSPSVTNCPSASYNSGASVTLTATPSTNPQSTFTGWSLPAGSTFTLPDSCTTTNPIPNKCTITMPNKDVTIIATFNLANTCARANPTVTITPKTQTATNPGAILSYTVTVKNNDNNLCIKSTYSLTSTVPSNWINILQTNSLQINPQQSLSTTFSVNSQNNAANGTYEIKITVTSGSFTSYEIASYVLSDNVKPTSITSFPQNGSSYNYPQLNKINGTAHDLFGISNVTIYIKDKTSNEYWKDNSFADAQPKFLLSQFLRPSISLNTFDWEYTNEIQQDKFLNGREYEICSKATDKSNNVEDLDPEKCVTFAYGSTCTPGQFKQDTCLVCNLQKAYEKNNTKCGFTKECQDDGTCKNIILSVYPKTFFLNLKTISNKQFNVLANILGDREYKWNKIGDSCSVSSYGLVSALKSGKCMINVSDATGANDLAYIKIINTTMQYEETKEISSASSTLIFNDNTTLELSLLASTTGNLNIEFYNTSPVELPNNSISLNKFLLIEPDKIIEDNVNSVSINITYNKNIVNLKNIDENTLEIFYYSIANEEWIEYYSNITKESAYGSYVSTNTNHLSLFGIFGNEIAPQGGPQQPGDGGRSGGKKRCVEDWRCTSWSSCINNQQTRICNDLNNCNNRNPIVTKPSEISSCITTRAPQQPAPPPGREQVGGELEEPIPITEKGKSNLVTYVIISFLLIAVISYIYRKKIFGGYKGPTDFSPKDKGNENNYRNIIDVIKKIKKQGYSDEQIKQRLREKGWTENEIDDTFKRL